MIILEDSCIGCEKCIPYCPVNAIYIEKLENQKAGAKIKHVARINRDECVECAVCYRAEICPVNAITEDILSWPRVIRRIFSDPFFEHKGTNVPGRGTEEMKTNDVTGRFKEGFVGIAIEFGRPGIGVRFSEVELATTRFAQMGFSLEPLNPVTQLIENPITGELKKDILNEKVLSAIVELIVPLDRLKDVIGAVLEISPKTTTVFCLDLITKVPSKGEIPVIGLLEELGIRYSVNGKVNVGLGRPLAL